MMRASMSVIVLTLILPVLADPSSAALEDDSCLLQTSLHASTHGAHRGMLAELRLVDASPHGAPELAYPQFISGKAKPTALRPKEVPVEDQSPSPDNALMQTIFEHHKADERVLLSKRVHSTPGVPVSWHTVPADEGGGAWGHWAGAVDLESSNMQTESTWPSISGAIKSVGSAVAGAAKSVFHSVMGIHPGGDPSANKAVYTKARANINSLRRMGWDPDPMPDPDPKPCYYGDCGGPGILSRAASAVGGALKSAASSVTHKISSMFR